jgi:predicted deacetylase
MLDLFRKYGVCLCLAVVPAWLTSERWRYLKSFKKNRPSHWCWHQHGWRHVNHEAEGKKHEFGNARSRSQIKRDLRRGRYRLKRLMGEDFYPVFTPPWNRCSAKTLQALKDLGYAAISRSRGSKPSSPKGLPDLYVDVDLHTRKERSAVDGWNNLMRELERTIASGFCGIMIHHQMMNEAAFDFLELLLKTLKNQKKIHVVNFEDLVNLKVFRNNTQNQGQ